MRRLALAFLGAAAVSVTVAQAADIPVKAPVYKAPPPIVAPVYNWSGIYVGGNVGYMWVDQDATWPGSALAITSFTHHPDSGIGGFQAGIQYQWTNIVLGVEFSWFTTFNNDFSTGSPQSGCPDATFTCQTRLDNVWTVGPRLGWALNDWLIYGTGGYADGDIHTRSFTTATGAVFDDFGHRHGGWYAGGGVEYAIWKSPVFDGIIGVEYQHIDLGTVQMLSPGDGGVFGPDTRDIRTTADLVRARLSIKGNFFH